MSTHPDARRVLDDAPTQLYVGGSWRDADGGATMPVEDPATGEELCRVADASVADGRAALDAAVAAQADWRGVPPQERSEILHRAFVLMQERSDDLALLMTLEMGKSLAESKGEIAYAAEFFRWFSGEALRIDGYFKQAANGQSRVLVMKQPVGPCLFITPWNFPAAMGTRKIGPAIAAGCTMVVKPAEQTPLSMLALARLLEDAGLPAGVLNVVPTSSSADLAAPLISDPRLRKLSFTGSTEVGRTLISQASEQVLKVSMELGGNAPFVVFEDADLDAAVDQAMVAKMRNMGEACTSANRFHVQDTVAEEFAAKLADRMRALTLGHGADEGTDIGPLIDADQRGKVTELVDDAVAKGATAVVGGGVREGAGYFFEPTVLTGVTADARLLKEEIFGPVAPIATFHDEAEAIAAANDTEFGLVSYLFTRDLSRALRVSEALETGMIGLNQGLVSNAGAPFGGVKQSGLGREGGNEGLAEYLETKYVAVKL
ncbi:succinate-semialdehyde dehydrogenase / glutarate-semialdehyde dehydrogenase [Nocardioides scoriae]|uniref:Succinate-semialdehyde dehydrogenase / glutarate-semialdehyde dehydrogenase n=1 Tax=Nocardioides scoriae TaxID=642780 RepID=A0A1H1YIZ6_9ACTN|nr:NAD-dependent succinate-semialdehyde dehydrogenase [Nocardioides scoriae]SDT21392.1 succinate-semialdehyde dehydrogenase / glutarate-semialdehyde dehydrogenase [Nocardioides scoriae]